MYDILNIMKKVLIVEDNKKYKDLISEALTEAKILHDTAGDGEEALKKLDSEKDFGLILLDLLMPKVDGVDLYHALQEKKKHIPIIVLTNVSETVAYGEDIKEVLIKSNVSLDEVVEKVKKAL